VSVMVLAFCWAGLDSAWTVNGLLNNAAAVVAMMWRKAFRRSLCGFMMAMVKTLNSAWARRQWGPSIRAGDLFAGMFGILAPLARLLVDQGCEVLA